ncbi:hypothetical protein TUM12370_02590 [Salmonella enterica subsp. enterica serovar Choleraesuis]|nr:hypothetical protein TUM12370_02590 [Salmonella enterica subsp. enterica serovar Choleraesuis]
MSKPPLFFIVIVAVIVVLAAVRFMHQRGEAQAMQLSPVSQVAADVVALRERPGQDRRSRQQEVIPAGTIMHYEADFALRDGAKLTFRISEAQYRALEQGMSGTLVFQGTHFIKFEAR